MALALTLLDLKAALKRHGLKYKLKMSNTGDGFGDVLHFLDVNKGIKVSGKIVHSFTEGEVYHWPLLTHGNLAPIIETIFIHENLSIFVTINMEITLRNLVHDEDFVHDPRCFERKKSYARGVFSGLSYLHSKSLCLMNLSDINIVICRNSDEAIITDFSCLICSRTVTLDKLCVSQMYRAPEVEKGEFDSTAADIWAGGVLMLDLFLSHMVPWAVVDYKPQQVMKLVHKLTHESLQAANIGSVISARDLEHFRKFLTCFFKDNPMQRITARNASIASFLCSKRYYVHRDNHANTPKCTKLNNGSIDYKVSANHNSSNRNIQDTYTTVVFQETLSRHNSSSKCSNVQNTSDKPVDVKDLSENAVSFPTKLAKIISQSTKENELKPASAGDLSIPSQLSDTIDVETVSDTLLSASTLQSVEAIAVNRMMHCNPQKISFLSYQGNSHGAKASPDNLCHQSRSLSFLKSVQNRKNHNSILKLGRNCNSYSNTKLLPEDSVDDALHESDLCLATLFDNVATLSEDACTTLSSASKPSDSEVSKEKACVTETLKSNEFRNTVLDADEENGAHTWNISEEYSPIQDIVHKIKNVTECQLSLKDHPKLCSSNSFEQKQREFLEKYQTLLYREKLRLIDVLRSRGFNIQEITKMTRAVKLKYTLNPRKNTVDVQCQTEVEGAGQVLELKKNTVDMQSQYVTIPHRNMKAIQYNKRNKDIALDKHSEFFDRQFHRVQYMNNEQKRIECKAKKQFQITKYHHCITHPYRQSVETKTLLDNKLEMKSPNNEKEKVKYFSEIVPMREKIVERRRKMSRCCKRENNKKNLPKSKIKKSDVSKNENKKQRPSVKKNELKQKKNIVKSLDHPDQEEIRVSLFRSMCLGGKMEKKLCEKCKLKQLDK